MHLIKVTLEVDGGYYGGGVTTSGAYTTSGGSSFISGYVGCNSIASSTDRTQTDGTDHYSGKIFTDGIMKAGNEEMPAARGEGTSIGNTESGYAKISVISNITLLGGSGITLFVADSYIEKGAKAYDVEGNDISSSITKLSNVNTNEVGEYAVTYSVTDPISMEVYSITRKVSVIDHIDYDFTSIYKVFTVTKTGTYKIQSWGASRWRY